MFYAICYVSTANILLDNEISELFSSVLANNQKHQISGILIHNSGNFLQYMEGMEEDVKTLYHDHIKKDDRHKDPIILMDKSINDLYFNGYETGFTTILEQNTIHKLRTYLNLLKYLDTQEVEAVTRTIETFLGKSSNK